jgi:hypothetical protein
MISEASEDPTKRRKNRKAARAIASARALERKASQAVLAYDIARYSAETIFYRVTMAQRTAMEPFGPEAFAMASEKMLAASEVMVIALRQLGPLQRLWTQAWFGQLSALQQSWQPEKANAGAGSIVADVANYWLRAGGLADAAALSQMKPIHRTVKGNARRLENLRMH